MKRARPIHQAAHSIARWRSFSAIEKKKNVSIFQTEAFQVVTFKAGPRPLENFLPMILSVENGHFGAAPPSLPSLMRYEGEAAAMSEQAE